jgi:hypothetical protein
MRSASAAPARPLYPLRHLDALGLLLLEAFLHDQEGVLGEDDWCPGLIQLLILP